MAQTFKGYTRSDAEALAEVLRLMGKQASKITLKRNGKKWDATAEWKK